MNRTVKLSLCSCILLGLTAGANADDRIDFNRDIRPILSNNCFQCHGPDESKREAGLRLDSRKFALAATDSGIPAIVPGKPDQSLLIGRIFTDDADELMPPSDSGKSLKPAEKELIKRWIAQGAEMKQHWAFVSPTRPALPKVKQAEWTRNEIDRFTLARMEARGWQPAPEASRAALIRRVSLDLTGLPPTLQEIDAFLADNSPAAWEKVVDRLLASKHFGERMAVDWLDAARFADTNGYHLDNGRDMSAWRAWVIDAFNRNLPFDQFTIEQIAGDLLPNATRDQQVASGFHRNHMINFEGGAIPEEYLTAYIIDRVNTTGAVWLGLTVGCGQCHDHKYDPLTQEEFYKLYAFFNHVPENGLDGNQGNAMPFVKVPTQEQTAQLAKLEQQISELGAKRNGDWGEIDAEQTAWETLLLAAQETAEEKAPEIVLGAWNSVGPMIHPEGANRGYKLNLGPEGKAVDLKAELFLSEKSYKWQPRPAWSDGVPVVLPGDQAVTYLQRTITVDKATKATISLGSDDAVKLWLNRKKLVESRVLRDVAADQHLVEVDLKPGENELLIKVVNFSGDGACFFALRSETPIRVPDPVRAIVATPGTKRSAEQQTAVRGYYRHAVSGNSELKKLGTRITKLRKKRTELDGSIRTSMVMKQMENPRDTFLLIRGQYNKKGAKVEPGTPEFLPPLPAGLPANRLGLARWLVDPSHPLVSRVIVNRFWQMIFGVGLVKTTEDFGAQGELPSHPELHDWLAVEFMNSENSQTGRWNMKALLKKIMLSATYRQSSRTDRELYIRDTENRLLTRGSRFRLQAEFIRDQVLSASGLMQHHIGGPSVSPYQPAGLWKELSSRGDSSKWTAQTFEQSHGADLYRRTMYTFWKRTSPPPTLVTFDAPDREICTVRRSRTNTPLQALILMNDPTYIEASRILAEKLLQHETTDASRFRKLFRLLTGRTPRAAELAALGRILKSQQSYYAHHKGAAAKLLSVGEAKRNEKLEAPDVAAWAMVVSAVMNLDETVTRN